eukprot:6190407-Pleurochrysis_carterae.AAC.4
MRARSVSSTDAPASTRRSRAKPSRNDACRLQARASASTRLAVRTPAPQRFNALPRAQTRRSFSLYGLPLRPPVTERSQPCAHRPTAGQPPVQTACQYHEVSQPRPEGAALPQPSHRARHRSVRQGASDAQRRVHQHWLARRNVSRALLPDVKRAPPPRVKCWEVKNHGSRARILRGIARFTDVACVSRVRGALRRPQRARRRAQPVNTQPAVLELLDGVARRSLDCTTMG